MKKVLTLMLLCLFVFSFAACVQNVNDPTDAVFEPTVNPDVPPEPGANVFYGMIVGNMGETLLVTENKTEGKTAGLFTLSAKYLDRTQDAGVLVPGTYFTLQYGGYIMESYPAQFGAPESFTCDGCKEDFVTPLTEFILEKIPSDAKWIALDLAGVDGLSDGEREAVEYLLESKKIDECGIVRYDPSFHTAEDLLADADSPAGGAVLRIEAQLQNGKLNGTWRLNDSETVSEGELDVSVPYYLN